jgi:hypothetical protein
MTGSTRFLCIFLTCFNSEYATIILRLVSLCAPHWQSWEDKRAVRTHTYVRTYIHMIHTYMVIAQKKQADRLYIIYMCVHAYIHTRIHTYTAYVVSVRFLCIYVYIYTYVRRTSEQLDVELTAVLFAPHTLLLGYSFESDVHKLIESFPHMKSLQALSQLVQDQATSFLDIQDLARAYLRLPRARPIGLSSACAKVLGSGLNKTMQVISAWVITFCMYIMSMCVCLESFTWGVSSLLGAGLKKPMQGLSADMPLNVCTVSYCYV